MQARVVRRRRSSCCSLLTALCLALPPALGQELAFIERFQFGERCDLRRSLVFTDPLDARKTQSKPRAVLRAPLDFVVRYFDDDLRAHADRITIIVRLKRPQPRGADADSR